MTVPNPLWANAESDDIFQNVCPVSQLFARPEPLGDNTDTELTGNRAADVSGIFCVFRKTAGLDPGKLRYRKNCFIAAHTCSISFGVSSE